MDAAQQHDLHTAICRLADGDRAAFDEVFEGLWPVLRRFAQSAMPNGADAEDVAQRTLLSVFARIHEFDTTRNGVAWAFGIASWEIRTLRRQIQRRRESDVSMDRQIAPAPIPEAQAIEAQLHAALADALGLLRTGDREALLADDRGMREAGVSAPAWRKRRQRALDRLRVLWRQRHG